MDDDARAVRLFPEHGDNFLDDPAEVMRLHALTGLCGKEKLLHDPVDPQQLSAHDIEELIIFFLLFVLGNEFPFQSLYGDADGIEGISYFVGHAGSQPPEGDQPLFHGHILLHLVQPERVLSFEPEYQENPPGPAEDEEKQQHDEIRARPLDGVAGEPVGDEYLHGVVGEIAGIQGLQDAEDILRPLVRAQVDASRAVVNSDIRNIQPFPLVLDDCFHDVYLPEVFKLLRAQIEKQEPIGQFYPHEEAVLLLAGHPYDRLPVFLEKEVEVAPYRLL